MSTPEIIVAALRGVHIAALISIFGTLIAIAMTRDVAAEAIRLRSALRSLVLVSVGVALIFGIIWLCIECAVIADANTITGIISAIPVVALQTQYGRWFTCRCVVLIVLLLLPLSRRTGLICAIPLGGIALAVQPLIGHAGAIGGGAGTELIASETLHVLAAGAWLGGLLPLLIAVSILPHQAAATACRNFTPVGLSAVLLLAGTAVVQVTELMGGLPGLFGTTYGHVALVKLGLFLVLIAMAATNRLVLTERLARDPEGTAQRHMRWSIAIEMMLGVAVVVAAGFLASLMPGTHEQPVWPFLWRPSLDAFYEPFLRGELVEALAAVGAGIALMASAIIWRRVRWIGLAVALVILTFALPHLDLLFVEAYPTSFFTSPTEFAATAIVHGGKLFAANCTACHGINGRGDGPAAKSLPLPPADLTAEHFWAHSDGELYWYVSHGFRTPEGGVGMPGFGGTLSSEAIWDLIDYLRANNAGYGMRTTGQWSHPLPVPQFDVRCSDRNTLDLDDLHGRVLRIVAAAGDEQTMPPPTADATTIFVVHTAMARPSNGACVTSEPETWTAFAILLGRSPDTFAGWQILVDRDAWLRSAWHAGQPGDWNDPTRLAERIRDIVDHPLAVSPGGHIHIH